MRADTFGILCGAGAASVLDSVHCSAACMMQQPRQCASPVLRSASPEPCALVCDDAVAGLAAQPRLDLAHGKTLALLRVNAHLSPINQGWVVPVHLKREKEGSKDARTADSTERKAA